MNLILGSSSKDRKAVMHDAGYAFETMSPDIDEKAIRCEDHYRLPILIAQAKRDAIIARLTKPAVVITADQVVSCAGLLHEKPSSKEEAILFLQRYSKECLVSVISALVVINTETGAREHGTDICHVRFNPISPSAIESFVESEDVLSVAGALRIESQTLKPFISRVSGSMDSIRGMPLELLKKLLDKVGYEN